MNEAIQSRWEQLCGRWAEAGYCSLSQVEQVWFNVRRLIDEVENGGLISYFHNSGADTFSDMIAALDELGASEVKAHVVVVADLFPGGASNNQDARNEVIDSWPDNDDQIE